MQFNYNEWFWSQQTEEYLYTIMNGGGLELTKQEPNKNYTEEHRNKQNLLSYENTKPVRLFRGE